MIGRPEGLGRPCCRGLEFCSATGSSCCTWSRKRASRLTTNTARTTLLLDGEKMPWEDWAYEFREKMPKQLAEFVCEKAAALDREGPHQQHKGPAQERHGPIQGQPVPTRPRRGIPLRRSPRGSALAGLRSLERSQRAAVGRGRRSVRRAGARGTARSATFTTCSRRRAACPARSPPQTRSPS